MIKSLFSCPCHSVLKGVPETFESPCGCAVTFGENLKNPIISENHVRGCDGECHSDALLAYKDAAARDLVAHRAYPVSEWAQEQLSSSARGRLIAQADDDVSRIEREDEVSFLRELVVKGVQAQAHGALDAETLYHLQASAHLVFKRIVLRDGPEVMKKLFRSLPQEFEMPQRKRCAPFWMLELVGSWHIRL